VVVTHGSLAHELDEGGAYHRREVPAVAAVSIGWGDDVDAGARRDRRGDPEWAGTA